MAAIGMRFPMFAPISAENSNALPTYGTGAICGHGIAANLTFNSRDNDLYGDDIVIERDNGLSDYSISLEVDELPIAQRETLLGYKKASDVYTKSAASAPYVGFGFIKVLKKNNVTKYAGYFFIKCQFTEDSENNSTKQKDISFGTKTMTGKGFGVFTDATGTENFYQYSEFATEALALTWLKGLLNVT